MDAFHHTPIVPSNAPPWTDLDHDSKVLREHCGNRQLGYVQTQDTNDYFANIGDDSTCGSTEGTVSAYQPLQFGHGIPARPHYPWMAGLVQNNHLNNSYDLHHQNIFNNVGSGKIRGPLGLGMYPSLGGNEKDREAEMKARLLAARFSRCEGYIKYRNRQPKEKKGSKEDAKWPDNIEDAFIIALCRHPPCGREKKKAPIDEYREDAKLMGRNELIADYILRNTGFSRTRKQVSSHIQVIKPFVLKEAIIMRMLATPTGTKSGAASKAAKKKASTYDPASQLSRTGQYNLSPLQQGFDPEPEEFCMFMRPLNTSETLHTYSATDGLGPTKFYVQTQAELYDCFPGLANIPVENLVTGKFLALHVPITLHPKPLTGGTELAIRWAFKSPAFLPHVSISSRTRFYLLGRPIYYDKDGNRQFYDTSGFEVTQQMQDDWTNLTKEYDAAEVSDHNNGLEVDSNGAYTSKIKNEQGRMVQYYVPFSSNFWARYLFHVAFLKRQIGELETRPLQAGESAEDRDELLQQQRQEVSSSLCDLIAVQEIIARTDMGEPQVVLTVHFTFSDSNEAAPTTWKHVDMTSAFDDAIAPSLSAGGASQISQQSASDSQDSAMSMQDTFGGGSHDDSSFDFSAPSSHDHHHQQGQYHTGYHDALDSQASTDLASPIDLHDTQASAVGGYTTSWLLQPTSDHHLPSTVLDPLLSHHVPQHDVNGFDFTNGTISISLDSSALSPLQHQHQHQHHLPPHHSSTSVTSSFSSAINALDLDDLIAAGVSNTDPSLLLHKAPERTTTPWLLTSASPAANSTATSATAITSPSATTTASAASTTTDYAALFSHANSPSSAVSVSHNGGGGGSVYADYGSTSAVPHDHGMATTETADLADHLAAAALPENFEVMSDVVVGQQHRQPLLPFSLMGGDPSRLRQHHHDGLNSQHGYVYQHDHHQSSQQDYAQHSQLDTQLDDEYRDYHSQQHDHDYQHNYENSQHDHDYQHHSHQSYPGAGHEISSAVSASASTGDDTNTTATTATGFEDFDVGEVDADFGAGFE